MVVLVVNRENNKKENYDEKKILSLIKKYSYELNNDYIDEKKIIQKISEGLTLEISIDDLSKLITETIAYMATDHPDYSLLAGRIASHFLHEKTPGDLLEHFRILRENKNSLINDNMWKIVKANHKILSMIIDYDRDFNFDYFGFKTLEKSYLLKDDNETIIERPQQLYMRVALAIHQNDIEKVENTYNGLSLFYYTHATPTLFNAGTKRQQLSSCFLLGVDKDSIQSIYKTLADCAQISKSAGGIGIHFHNVRSRGGYISGSNGHSNGIIPFIKVFNETAKAVDQAGKRKGAFAIYLEPWHGDIFDFIELKKQSGKDEFKARDLFYGLWINDLFMQRVEADEHWTLFNPVDVHDLIELYGKDFESKYLEYENQDIGKKIKARDLWYKIIESQIETGGPYMLYKDAANIKSNQKNLGTIKCSNLCTEIIQHTSNEETAVCNLASINLSKCIINNDFDYDILGDITEDITENLNKVININYYPTIEGKESNLKHRPIGIGVQGLADTFAKLKIPFTSDKAKDINKKIFEVIYYHALKKSNELASTIGCYYSFEGSPASEGILQFDMWKNYDKSNLILKDKWDDLKNSIKDTGLCNSLLIAPMPTASTSQILGNNECFEPFTSNIYSRRVLAGEFPLVNKYLVNDLIEKNLWNKNIKNKIIMNNGSVQDIDEIPNDIKELHKIVWEMSMKDIIDMAADRGVFIDQSQSLNLFMAEPNSAKLTSMHIYAWKKGLKTGMYYLRSKPVVDAIKYTVDCTSCGS